VRRKKDEDDEISFDFSKIKICLKDQRG